MEGNDRDPFSMSCVERPSVPPTLKKVPKPPKKAVFYSKAGQERLIRIWDENNLSEELIFAGGAEVCDSFLRGKVSDYVQHYLFQRPQRVLQDKSLTLALTLRKCPSQTGKPFKAYDDFISSRMSRHQKLRVDAEKERVAKLLHSGEGKVAPEGFESIFEDPIFKMKRLMESVHAMEKANIDFKEIPFSIKTTKIKCLKENHESFKDEELQMLIGRLNCKELESKSIKHLSIPPQLYKRKRTPESEHSSGFYDSLSPTTSKSAQKSNSSSRIGSSPNLFSSISPSLSK